jgi:hypothetical protein
MEPAGTFVAGSVATLHLKSLIASYVYSTTIQGVKFSATAQNATTYDDMLLYDSGNVNASHHLVDAIKAGIEAQHTAGNAAFAGSWYLEGYTTSLVIKRTNGTNQVVTDYSTLTGTPVAFTIDAKGGPDNSALEAFEDSVTDISKLPVESFHDHNVQVLNSASAEDDYYVKFVAFDGVKGRGYIGRKL